MSSNASSNPAEAVWQALPDELRRAFFIDGEWRQPASSTMTELISPVTEDVMLTVPSGAPEDMDQAVAAARRAFDEGPWPRLSYAERGAYLDAIARELEALGDLLARVHTAQTAAPIMFAGHMSGTGAAAFGYYAGLADTLSESDERPVYGGRAIVDHEPVGVAAIVTPWNAPLALFSLSAAAALMAGCTVVAKPSAETPFDALLVAWCAAKVGLPAGVLNVVPAGRDAGDSLIRDPRVDKISFTGSTEAGRHVAQIGASRLARVTLELGGKSAAIVTADADLGATLQHLVPWSMPFTGQVCFALTRILVPDHRFDEIAGAYVGAMQTAVIGDPWDPATQMGPLINARQYERVNGYIERGREEGATLLTGGHRPAGMDRGFYVAPTVFRATPDMTIAREEIFGPVVSVIPYGDEDEAVRIANATSYGLSGAVFARDDQKALAIARRLRTGSVNVNTVNIAVSAPNGGFKESGIGRTGGIEGIRAYQECRSLYLPA